MDLILDCSGYACFNFSNLSEMQCNSNSKGFLPAADILVLNVSDFTSPHCLFNDTL
jgi:hypothetical protein